MIGIRGAGLGAAAILAAYGAAFVPPLAGLAPWLMAGGISVLLPSVLGLGLKGPRWLRVMIAGTMAVVPLLGLLGALVLGPEPPGAPLVLGLPRRAALLLYGVGLLPGPVLSLLYAATFERSVLSRQRLDRLREGFRVGPDQPPPA
jgi:hypothetical protein